MKAENMRIKLIKSTIHTVSNVGIDRTTTKLLSANSGLNEVYIYRIFGGKEALFEESFLYIDKQFAAHLLKCFKMVIGSHDTIKSNFRKMFSQLWIFTLNDQEKCSFFIRYYYSRYYSESCSKKRKKLYNKVMSLIKNIFNDNTDTWWLFNYMLDVIFASAVKVLRNEIPNNLQTEENVFSLLYAALKSHLK